MKARIFTGLFLCCISLSSQHRLTSELNMIRPGDEIIKQQVEYTDPGQSGENAVWDLGKPKTVRTEYTLVYSTENDTLITGTEHLTMYRYTLENDSLLLWGFDNQTTLQKNKLPELQLKFPFMFGDTIKSYYFGYGKYGNRLEAETFGTIETRADAYGMMILPDGDTLKNVLRTRTLKCIVQDIRSMPADYYEKLLSTAYLSPDSIDRRLQTDSTVLVTETFRWYAKGYRYPIFETVKNNIQLIDGENYNIMQTAFFYPPQAHSYLSNDGSNPILLKEAENSVLYDPWKGLVLNCHPNPVKNHLDTELYLPRSVKNLRLQIRNSMGLIMLDENKGSLPEGTYHFRLSAYNLIPGSYILDIRADDKLISEVILKE